MAQSHNTDVPMGEEELDASFSVDSFFADEPESPAGPSNPPPAKKLCGEGSSSAPPASASGPRAPLPRGNSVPPTSQPAATSQQTRSATETSIATGPALSGPLNRLRRNRENIGVVADSLVRDTDCLTTIIFPDSAESHRYKIVDRIRQGLRGRDFGGVVPKFDHAPGEILRLPRRSYCRHILQWPTKDAALHFRNVLPLTYRAEGVSAEIKFYQDPEPEYSAARAAGTTHLVIRNVPIGFAIADILTLLTKDRRPPARRWLKELRHFHKAYDPYDRGKLIGQNPAAHAFKQDPGLLYIGLEGDVEACTCGVCSFCCGWALDSAMQHLKTSAHQSRLLDTVKKAAPIVELGDTPAHLFVQRGAIANFLTEEV
ncbi:unnamed protein product [Closterium sp. Naga37s-1]|nr:unnamed protein product [Closterium sp. Naga37s-1]